MTTSYQHFSVAMMRSIFLAVSVGLLVSMLFSFPACEAARRRGRKNPRQGKLGRGGRRWQEGDIRLIRGRSRSAGTVLLYHEGKWGTVCDDMWNVTDSDVVCRQKGFSGSLRTPLKLEFGGRGKRRIWITRVQCQGNEKRLLDCDYVGWGRRIRHMCPGRWRAVGVVCHPKPRHPAHRSGRKKLRSRHARWLARRARARKAAAAARERKALKVKTTPKPTQPFIVQEPTENPFDVATKTYPHKIDTLAPSQGRRTYTSLSKLITKAPTTSRSPNLITHRSPQNVTLTSLSRNSSSTERAFLRPFAMYADLADIPVAEQRRDSSAAKDSVQMADAKVATSSVAEKMSSLPFKPTLRSVAVASKTATSTSTILTTRSIINPRISSTTTEKKASTKEKAAVATASMPIASETNPTEGTTTTTKPKMTSSQDVTASVKPTSTTQPTSENTMTEEITTKTIVKTTSTPEITTTATSTTKPSTAAATTTTTTPKTTTTEETTITAATEPQTTSTQELTTVETTPTSTTPNILTEEIASTIAPRAEPETTPSEITITTITTRERRPKTTSTEEKISVTSAITTASAATKLTTQEQTVEVTSAASGATVMMQENSREDDWQKEDSSVLADSPDLPELDLQLTGGRYPWEGRLEVRETGSNPGPWGSVCGVTWSLRESMVACREMGHGYGKQALKANYFGGRVKDMIFYSFNCTGRESRLSQCPRTAITPDTACPRSTMIAGVVCATHLPDLVPDTEELQKSVRLQDRPLYYLQCALEENCLSSSAYHVRNNDSNWRSANRRLLRFSTVVHNRGESDFRPNVAKAHWQWHACHMHFHSMEVFAHYDILDEQGTRLAEGSKASFCLEDTTCDRGKSRMYNCEGFGDQGLSVNCSDNYSWDIDCQWIDVTDIEPGIYTFLMEVNPQMLVAEKDFDNNVIHCVLWYSGYEAKFRDCHHQSLFDYRR